MNMWFILPILSGISQAFWSAISKKTVSKINIYWVTFSLTAFSLPFIFFSLFWFDLSPLNWTFWWSTFVSAILSLLGLILTVKAFKLGDLSMLQPLFSFIPVFLVLTSIPLLNEIPSLAGFLGILLIVAGTYFVNLGKGKGILGPFIALANNKAARLILLVCVIYSVSSATNKIAVQSSNPATYIIFVQTMMALMLIPFILKLKEKIDDLKPQMGWLFFMGILVALELFFQMIALQMTLASYVISLKRISAVVSVVIGITAFKESGASNKLAGSILMILGAILISLS